jgi:hypothetical protein
MFRRNARRGPHPGRGEAAEKNLPAGADEMPERPGYWERSATPEGKRGARRLRGFLSGLTEQAKQFLTNPGFDYLSCWKPAVLASAEIHVGTPMNIDLEQTIRERAYQIWEREGRVHGRHEEHWHSARLELAKAPEAGPSVAVKPPGRAAGGPKKAPARAKPKQAAPVPAPAKQSRRTPARTAP